MTLKLSKQALICVTVLLYICFIQFCAIWLRRLSNHLFTETKPAKQKAHAKDEQQIGQYRTQKGSLNNLNFILREKDLLVLIAGGG